MCWNRLASALSSVGKLIPEKLLPNHTGRSGPKQKGGIREQAHGHDFNLLP